MHILAITTLAAVAVAPAGYIKLGDINGEADRAAFARMQSSGGTTGQDDWIATDRLEWGSAGSMLDGADVHIHSIADIRVNRWENSGRAPRDAASGMATGKRQHAPVAGGDAEGSGDAVRPRDNSSGQASGRRQYEPSAARNATAGNGVDEDCDDACAADAPLARGVDKASPLLMHRRIDKATPILMATLRSDHCPAGLHISSIDVREGQTLKRLADVTVEGCRTSALGGYDAMMLTYASVDTMPYRQDFGPTQGSKRN